MENNLFGKIEPTWNKEDLKNLLFVDETHRDKELNNTYVTAGHNLQNMAIGILQENMIFPDWAIKVKQNFNFKNITTTIHRLRPGNYLPIHFDLYQNYKKIFNVSTENIYRIIVFLEDWQPGHMLDINNKIYNNWSAGDYVGWINDTPHAAYNFGLNDRYTLQITGTE